MKTNVEVLPPQENQTQLVLAPAVPPTPKEKKPLLQEKEIHRAMLGYYFALGPSRTLSKVAEHFGKTKAMIEKYSHLFSWKERIAELENRSRDDCFKDQVQDLLLLLLGSLTKPDESGVASLVSSPKVTAETIKLCVSSFRELKQEAREEADNNDSGKDQRLRIPLVLNNFAGDKIQITVMRPAGTKKGKK